MNSVTILTLQDAVKADLKNQKLTPEQEKLLKYNPDAWLEELIGMKVSCESQMVASKARAFQAHMNWVEKQISHTEYLTAIQNEKKWRCDSALFLQNVEKKIRQVKSKAWTLTSS